MFHDIIYFIAVWLPNQSLKLTEVAVDDFAARQITENYMINRYIRAMNYMEMAARRRSLAPVRYAAELIWLIYHTKICIFKQS